VAPDRPDLARTTEGARVEFRDVRRDFGTTAALAGLSLTIEPGELVALLGPSGCGKTTALRILAGFDSPTAGSVLVDGDDVVATPANRREMGMVFQSYSLFPSMTARDNVAFGPRLRRDGKAGRRTRAGELLELVGLSDHTEKYPHQLSGGQQQRVALARALAISPRVLLLDEPLSALDAKVREQLRDEIRRLQVEVGVTTLFVTHDQEEALSIADRVGVLNAGRLEQCAPPDDLYHRPATPFVAQFVGTMNHLAGVLEADRSVRVRASDQVLPVSGGTNASAGGAVTVLVRPESVRVEPDPQGTAVVTLVNFRGATTRLQLTLADGVTVLADVSQHDAGGLGFGERARITLREQPVLVAAEQELPALVEDAALIS
jgi:putative spermidine/putrescine transport system ATP-binding protein